MICCDTCPFSPTCEEIDDEDDWGEEDATGPDPGDFEWGDDESPCANGPNG